MVLAVLLLVPSVYAQLDWKITDLRCGNHRLDQFELCEKGFEDNESFCDELGTLLEIDTVCDVQHCTCLPRVNKAYCGNDKREGVEVCDGTAPDLCEAYGNLTNLSLSCDKKTCGCVLKDSLPSDYDSAVVDGLTNLSQKSSVCGDKKVERNEDCDPPNTLCTTNTKEPGVCTQKCKCVKPELLGEEEETVVETEEPKSNVSVSNESVIEVESEPEEEVKEEVAQEPGVFSRLWSWIVSIFS